MTIVSLLPERAPSRWPRLAAIFLPLVTAVGLAVVGAFGSYVSMGLPVRLLHFVAAGLAIGGLAYAMSALARRHLFAGNLPFWAMIVIAAAAALPGALIIQQLLRLLAPHVTRYVSYGELTLQVLTVNLLLGVVIWALHRRSDEASEPVTLEASSTPETDAAAVRTKLPIALRQATILSLSAEDHYVRVRTDRGETLILMNLSHAAEALGADAGIRIHRSHWIARTLAESATMRNCRNGRNGIRVDEGTFLPISRAGRKLLNGLRE